MTVLVQAPGLLSSIQAAPRWATQHLGVSAAGPMDGFSHRLANTLVGNDGEAGVLEITLVGPDLLFEASRIIALCGADLGASVEGRPLPRNVPVRVRADSLLRFEGAKACCRAYLAVAGGWSVPRVLGSRSTDLKGGFGGLQGRALKAGDRLFTGAAMDPFPRWGNPNREAMVVLPFEVAVPGSTPEVLRLVPGPHLGCLRPEARQALETQVFTLDPRSDRQGLRLLGPALLLQESLEITTAGVAFGTVQLPPEGHPIILMADRQSTGGYPRLGEVYAVDLPRAAQARPGEALTFRVGEVQEARRLAHAQEGWFQELQARVRQSGN